MSPSEFTLTKHAIERLLYRFHNTEKSWKAITSSSLRLKFVYDLFSGAKECKSIHNDTEFMTYVYMKYGTESKYTFFVLDDAVFIGRGTNIVTVIRKSLHPSARAREMLSV